MKTAMLHRLAVLDSASVHETGRPESRKRGNEGASIAQIQKRQARQVMSRVLRHWAAGIKLLQAGLERAEKVTDITLYGSRAISLTGTITKVRLRAL